MAATGLSLVPGVGTGPKRRGLSGKGAVGTPSYSLLVQVCGTCGQENPDVARFCLACGAALAADEAAPQEERRFISVLFVDLVGFTARAEQLDPEDVRAILTPYHDTVRREIESFGGVVEKFVGDAVMSVFGAPTAYGDDAERAVRAALAVRDSVAALNDGDGRLDLQIRIAVNTGEALVSLGARPSMGESMVAGDVVNTASRLQQAAPVNGIIVGRETFASTRAAIKYEPAQPVEAKGKAALVPAWIAITAMVAAGERTISRAPLVGRGRELGVLQGIWERVADERTPTLVTIVGQPGVGKTRLGIEFGRVVRELGGRSVRGRSLPYRDSSAYGAFAAQLKQFTSIFESDPIEVAVQKLHDSVTSLLGPSEADEVAGHLAILLGFDRESSVADRETLFFSVRRFIEAVAGDQPTMLVFEDVHWADRSLLDLIELLAARLRDLPILLLALARPELLDARPGWGGGLPAYTALPLEQLKDSEARELAVHLLSKLEDRARAERAAILAETSEGNPLFIEQLVATLTETSGDDSTLPTTIRGIVAARLDALPAPERAVLLDAAVGGKVFWRGALEHMSDDPEGLPKLLGALEGRDLIRRQAVSAIEGDQQFTFRHMLIRDVAYDLLPRARKRERHAQVAEFLQKATSETGEAAAALGRHWREAGENERAIEHLVAAAEEAERGWAKDRAVAFYRESLELLPEDDGNRRSDLKRRLAMAHTAAYHVRDARMLRLEDDQEGLAK
jgi:class 3 adenylate cyclase